jgi:hypothetical protein
VGHTLGDLLRDWRQHQLDASIYLPAGVAPSLDTEVNVLPFDRLRKRLFDGQEYLLGIEQVRDVIEGLERELGRQATPKERLRAVVHFARYDAFIEPSLASQECLHLTVDSFTTGVIEKTLRRLGRDETVTGIACAVDRLASLSGTAPTPANACSACGRAGISVIKRRGYTRLPCGPGHRRTCRRSTARSELLDRT